MATNGRKRTITEEEYAAVLPTMPDVTSSSESAKVLTADEYFKVVHNDVAE